MHPPKSKPSNPHQQPKLTSPTSTLLSFLKKIKPNYLSFICICISSFTWVTGYLYSNQHNIHPVQTSFQRGFMIMVVSAVICVWKGDQVDLRIDGWVVMKRNVVFVGQAYVMCAIQFYLPLGVIHTIGLLGPISVSIYQYIFDNKKQSIQQILSIILALIGVILTANGRLISKFLDPDYIFQTQFKNYITDDAGTIALASFFAAGMFLLTGYAVYLTNCMKASPFVVNFLFGIKMYLISALILPYILPTPTPNHSQIPPQTFYYGTLNATLFGLSQTLFILGIVLSQNIGLTIMACCSNVLIAYFVSLIKYRENFNVFCVVGAVCIVFGLWRIVMFG